MQPEQPLSDQPPGRRATVRALWPKLLCIWGLPAALVLSSTALFPTSAQGSEKAPRAVHGHAATGDEHADDGRPDDERPDHDAVGREDSAKVFVTTPSSEPGQIYGLSELKVYDPRTLKPQLADTVEIADPKPHHLYPIPGRDIALQAHFGSGSITVNGAKVPAQVHSLDVVDLITNEHKGKIDTGPTGLGARHLSFNPDYTRGYSANFDGNTISVLDLVNLKLVKTIAVGSKPNYVQRVDPPGPTGPRLFVENFGANTVTVIDETSLQVIDTVTVGNGPFNASVAEGGRTLITADARDNTVSFLDTRRLRVTQTVAIGGVIDPTVGEIQRLNPRISPEGKWLWVGNQRASVFSIVNIPQRRLEKLLPAGKGADIAFFPAGGPAKGLALLTNRYDSFVTVAKLHGAKPPTAMKKIRTSALGSHYITYNSDFSRGYVSERPGRAFSVLDMRTLKEVANVPVGPGAATDPDNTDPAQAGPDQAFYVWFKNGHAFFHEEHSAC